MKPSLKARERYIADHQLDAQERIIGLEITRAELEITEYSSAKAWVLYDELKLLRESVRAARRDLHQIPVKRKSILDRLVIKLYSWSVQDRLQ